MLVEHQINPSFKWIETHHLSTSEKNILRNEFQIPEETLEYVMDIYERSNYITDSVNDIELVVIHVPTKQPKDIRYVSRPVSFLVKDDMLFSFNEAESTISYEGVKESIEQVSSATPMIFLFELIRELIDRNLPILREISKERHQLDDLLTERVKNKDLVRLSYLQQTLTFLLSASENNLEILEQIKRSKLGRSFDEQTMERLEDAIIEANQVAHMTELESDIVDRIARIFDSIMNNNLNDTMKFLTVWSLALAIPTLITGFYGMNIDLPRLSSDYEWIYVVILSVILIIWLIMFINHKRK
ncbi:MULTISPECIES: magnesium transporter CorA family protein [Vagococcus]|uniref:magnesium transporter CorA family protein n=1 Tax=Vagococcus TaxID=2737 RepID=UPI00131413F7|nr:MULTISPECIES: magnesium transporter CorA family protein [Vagococcus]